MSDFIYHSAITLARMIRQGEATSTDIVSEHLARIKQYNERFHALISLFEEEALHQAAQCDEEARKGIFRGPLHGVPVTVKEAFWLKGKKSNINFRLLKSFVAPQDAVVIERLRKSGAIILGQTNVPRNLIDYQVQGDIYPEGKNPFDTERTPGGSTGGGAAALAAGFSPLELGSDFGGSIRVPASFCGLYSLKPTDKTVPLHGNVPLPKNVKTFLIHMVQAGPLARNPHDLELLWKTIVGPHESDRNIPDIDWRIPHKTLPEFKIAWTAGWPGFEASKTVEKHIEAFANKLQDAGAIVVKTLPDETLQRDSLSVYAGLFPYVISQGMPWWIRLIVKRQLRTSLLRGIGHDMQFLTKPMNAGFKGDVNHYGEVMLQRAKMVERWETFFNEYDLLLCPVTFGPAFKRCKIGTPITYEGKTMPYIKYVWPFVACFNASGHPGLTIPLGLSSEGLPIGVQVVSRYWSEPLLFQFAKLTEALVRGFVRPELNK